MGTLLIFIIVLGLLVFVHEFGHFVAARLTGVGVEEFAFGFPPRLWGVKRKETTYSVNWIPVGGFVRLHGEDGTAQDATSFVRQRAWKRATILAAGVCMNVLLAAVIFSFGFVYGLPTDISDGVPAGAFVRNPQVQVVSIADGSAAAEAGLHMGDALVAIGSTPVGSVQVAQEQTRAAGASTVSVTYRRGNVTNTVQATLKTIPGTDVTGLGVSLINAGTVSFSPLRAIGEGLRATWTSLVAIIQAFGQLLSNLVVHRQVSADVAGPVGIAVLTGQVARLGFGYLVQFTALLSLNLALINILPIPALDGGRILFLLIEKLRGKPLGKNLEARIHTTGFALLLGLIALITLRDVLHLQAVRDLWDRLF